MAANRLRHPNQPLSTFQGMVTVAPQMTRTFELIQRAARSNATVLVRGESGTGKELAAQAIHASSPRRDQPFRAVNCATFTAEMLASQLFGHIKGAFTGAVADRQGLLAQANRGSLFLDEVAELPLPLQARLLRVIQTRRFVPVGATPELESDVRFISATNSGLRKLVSQGQFREDLMYRLRVVVIYLPRLVDRDGDLEALTWHFIDHFNQQAGYRRIHAIDATAWSAMQAYGWPGNIRELRNNLESAFVLGEGPVLHLEDLAPELHSTPDSEAPLPDAPPTTLDTLRRQELVDAFKATGGKRQEMARVLGISRPTLYRRLKRYGLT